MVMSRSLPCTELTMAVIPETTYSVPEVSQERFLNRARSKPLIAPNEQEFLREILSYKALEGMSGVSYPNFPARQ